MNIKLPAPYLFAILLTGICLALYLIVFRENRNSMTVLSGVGAPTILALIGHYIIEWALNKSGKKFFVSFFSVSAARIVLLLGAIYLAFLIDKTQIITFVIALLSAYFLFLIAEILVLSRLKLRKRDS